MIILIGNKKGGVGKSVSTNHLAHAAQKEGLDACIVDFDDGASLFNMATQLEFKLPVYEGNHDQVGKQLRALKHDYIFVDTPANDLFTLKRVADLADEVIVPIYPAGIDINMLGQTLTILEEVETNRETPLISILITRFDSRIAEEKEAIELLESKPDDYPLFKTKIRQLARYKKYAEPTYFDEYLGVLRELEIVKGELGAVHAS